jgi:3-deoxy-manno-octulosonate cytidylyltransferase (CMP-KDO synthetase)
MEVSPMRCAIVIPARYASTRLPGKPLLRSTGKYLIQHVYEQALRAKRPSEVVIATDDSRIVAAVEGFGGKAVMTRRDHFSGTDRVAEVANRLDADVIVNLQGDEPLIEPRALDLLPELLEQDRGVEMATLAVPLASLDDYYSPNVVKVVRDRQGRALYFSRSPIPMVRDGEPNLKKNPQLFLQHLGLYAYRREALLKLASLPPESIEQTEKLEQLRVLAMGWRIQVGVVAHAGRGVDTAEDYELFVRQFRSRALARAA